MPYPVRPVDTTTDFEGTTSLQPTQPVMQLCLYLSPHFPMPDYWEALCNECAYSQGDLDLFLVAKNIASCF